MSLSVLIVLTGSLGDVVRGLALPTLLKRGFPEGRLGWVVEHTWRDIVAQHSSVDEIFVLDRRRPVSSVARLWRVLRAEAWDISLDLQRILKSGSLTLMSGARRRIGFPPAEAKELNHLFQTEWISARTASGKMERYLDFARHLGLETTESLDFGLGRVAPAWDLVGPERPLITLVLGSAWPSKDWPSFRALELARLVTRRSSLDLVLVGDGRRRDEAAAIARDVAPGRVVDLVGRTTLAQLAGVLRASAAATGPDSGPGHVAAAVGTPYVGLFGPTDPAREAPYGCGPLAVAAPRSCEGCPRRRCRRPPGESCMASITPQAVYERLESSVRRGRSGSSAISFSRAASKAARDTE
jgi:ADP-heptose:LPS heptosyltransferase